MEVQHRDIIRENFEDLTRILSVDVGSVVNFLYSKGIISDVMKADIMRENYNAFEKADALLTLLPNRGAKAFPEFLNAVIRAELYSAADILDPQNAPHHPY